MTTGDFYPVVNQKTELFMFFIGLDVMTTQTTETTPFSYSPRE
jgi:hypothetical protein